MAYDPTRDPNAVYSSQPPAVGMTYDPRYAPQPPPQFTSTDPPNYGMRGIGVPQVYPDEFWALMGFPVVPDPIPA